MPRPASDLKHRILDAARAAFDQRAVDAVSLRTIARAAGTTIGMVYYYFPTKDDLYFALFEEVYARVLPDLIEAFGGDAPLRDKLARVMTRLREASDAERTVLRVTVRDALVSPARRRRLFERLQRGHVPVVLAAFARAAAAGELRTDVPTALSAFAALALAALGTLVVDHLPLPGMPPAEERAELLLATLFAGIGAADRPRRPERPRRRRRQLSA
jgi:AcrR family transcriptional regulator